MTDRTSTQANDLANVPDGWTARAWAERLRYLANACQDVVPARATELRDAAILVDVKADEDEARYAPAPIDPTLFELLINPREIPTGPRRY